MASHDIRHPLGKTQTQACDITWHHKGWRLCVGECSLSEEDHKVHVVLKQHVCWHQLQCRVLVAVETNSNEVLPQRLWGLVDRGKGWGWEWGWQFHNWAHSTTYQPTPISYNQWLWHWCTSVGMSSAEETQVEWHEHVMVHPPCLVAWRLHVWLDQPWCCPCEDLVRCERLCLQDSPTSSRSLWGGGGKWIAEQGYMPA